MDQSINFKNQGPRLSQTEIEECLSSVHLRFPDILKELYLSVNGGEPDRCIFEYENVDTLITELLPLLSKDKPTSIQSYKILVLDQNIVPKKFFPFAVDAGGDYFFIDIESPHADVYLYRHDTANTHLINLNLDLANFMKKLRAD